MESEIQGNFCLLNFRDNLVKALFSKTTGPAQKGRIAAEVNAILDKVNSEIQVCAHCLHLCVLFREDCGSWYAGRSLLPIVARGAPAK